MVTGRPALHLSPLDSSRNTSLLVLAYSPSNGIITIFRLMLSLDYIEDYITQIKICQALFFLGDNLSLHTGLVLFFQTFHVSFLDCVVIISYDLRFVNTLLQTFFKFMYSYLKFLFHNFPF